MGIMGITTVDEPPQRPESETPGIAATPPTRGDQVECYSNGVRIAVGVWSRQTGVAQELFQQLTRGGAGGGSRVGFRVGDGAVVWHPRSAPVVAQAGEPAPGLDLEGGRASETRLELQFWLTPLPAADLVCVVDLPDHGLPDARLVISGALLLEASRRAEPLWQ